MTSDPRALLTVLLARTGLTQTDAAPLLGVSGRTVRRWIEGVRTPPAVAIDRLAALARDVATLIEAAPKRGQERCVRTRRSSR
jgi:predicted transcriptional regulator